MRETATNSLQATSDNVDVCRINGSASPGLKMVNKSCGLSTEQMSVRVGSGLPGKSLTCNDEESDSDDSVRIIEEMPLAKRLKPSTLVNDNSCSNHFQSSVVGTQSQTLSRLTHSLVNHTSKTETRRSASWSSVSVEKGVVLSDGSVDDSSSLVTENSSQDSVTLSQVVSSSWSQTVDSQESEGSGSRKTSRRKLTEEERERRNEEKLVCWANMFLIELLRDLCLVCGRQRRRPKSRRHCREREQGKT